jgi:carbon monoxide dehydrogenase subunit G
LKISTSFDVDAPLAEVWPLLTDIPRVAGCIPNARLTETVDERTYRAEVGVRAGPIAVTYRATIHIEGIDPETHTIAFGVRGEEIAGRGDVGAHVVSQAVERGASTHVTIEAETTLTGLIATVGSRLIEGVAKMTIAAFARELARVLAAEVR